MKSKINKLIFFTLLPIICFAVIGFFGISSFVNSKAFAYSGNGGIFYVGKNSVYNHTTGTISGASATNGGAFYVDNGGTLNINGGFVSGNTATQNGNNIYNAGITTINRGGVGDIIEFGSYPQTIKASNVTVDESKYKTNQAGGKYYLGSDGEYYAKFTANPSSSSYVFSDGTTIVSGTSYYFKVEPIKWRILSEDNGQAIILAELILDAHQFYSSTSSRTIDGKTIYANNYKYSDIRSWLNGYSSTYGEDWNNKGFLQRAFSESEQEYIQTTLVDNSAFTDAYGSTADFACENTNDKVWLLSYQDMINTSYGFNSDRTNYDTMRRKKTSDYSRANYAYYYTSSDYVYNGRWWARSPSLYANGARGSDFSGDLVNYGVSPAYGGVVPALTISFNGKAGDTPVSWSFASGASGNNASVDTLHKSETLATNSKANSIFNFNTFATTKEYNNTLFGFNAFINANYYLNTLYNLNILIKPNNCINSLHKYLFTENDYKNSFNTPQYIVNTITNIDLLSDNRKNYALLFGNKRYKAFYEPKVYELA